MKFGLQYKLTIETAAGSTIIVELPFTIEFDLQRTTTATLNSLTLQVYNLSETHRSQIFQDRFNPQNRKITLEMGYENLSVVFKGDIFEANSTRAGSDIVTTIFARDGYFDVATTTVVPTTLTQGQTLQQVLTYLFGQFPTLKKNTVLNSTPGMKDVMSQPVVLSGNVYELIKKYANMNLNNVYIDLEVINIFGCTDVIVNNEITVLNADTGLVNSPRRDQASLTVTTLLEPRVTISQIIQLQSKILPEYNGYYKVLGITHRGKISGSVDSYCESMFTLLGNQLVGNFRTVA